MHPSALVSLSKRYFDMFKKISKYILVSIIIFGCSKITVPLLQPKGEIAYLSRRDSDSGYRDNLEIFIMSEDGSWKRNLTNYPGHDYSPHFSHCGSKIAFLSERDERYHMYMMDITGGRLVSLVGKAISEGSIQFSPDGTKILFVVGDGYDNYEIFIMDSDGRNQVNLTNHPAGDFSPHFADGGTKIIFGSDRDSAPGGYHRRNIYIMDVSGSNIHWLTKNDSSNYFCSISPDGSWILYNSNADGNMDVYKMRFDGSGKQNLTNNPAWDRGGSFSKDGTKIMFRSTRKNLGPDICIMDCDGSNQKILLESETAENDQQFSPDGTKILFTSWSGNSRDIYTMDLDGQNIKQLTNDEYDNLRPMYRPKPFD